MFNKIEIERFRGIRYANIEGFKQINIFFGKNNCGKSSLLESLFMVSGISNPLLPVNVNTIRGYASSRLDDLKLDFYNLDSSQPIHIRVVDGETRDLKISLIEQNENSVLLGKDNQDMLSNFEEEKYGLKLDFKINEETNEAQLQFDPKDSNKATRTLAKDYDEPLRCKYLSPKYDFSTSIQGLSNILQNKDEHFIVEGLQIIEPKVRDFIYTDNVMLVDTGLQKRIPVNMMGDGARKIVALLTAIYECPNGALLIDEISNGFHYSVMKGLWEVLINAAIKNNTQLYVTTHDYDSIVGLRDAAIGKYDDMVASFKLMKLEDGELKAYHYSLDSLDYSINQEIEVR